METRLGKIGQRWQEACKGFARTGISHQQGVPPPIAGNQHIELVPPDAPIAPGKPIGDLGRNVGLHQPRSAGDTILVPGSDLGTLPGPCGLVLCRLIQRLGRIDEVG